MSLATYADLQASIAAWATKSTLGPVIPDFVAWAHQEICRKLRAPVLYARATVNINAETIATPAGFLACKRFYIDGSPRYPLMLADSLQVVDMTMEYPLSQRPTHFAVEGTDTLAFAPLFDTTASFTGQMLYYKAPATLVGDGDTNVVLAKYPYLYLWGALEALFTYLEDDNNADRNGAKFGALIQSINDQEAADAFRGPLVGRASGAVV